MKLTLSFLFFAVFGLFSMNSIEKGPDSSKNVYKSDVLVIGGGAGGVADAIQSARMDLLANWPPAGSAIRSLSPMWPIVSLNEWLLRR